MDYHKFAKEEKGGILLLVMFGVSSATIGILSELNWAGPTVQPPHDWQEFNVPLNLRSSGSNPNLTRTGYAVTLSQYGAPRLFDPAGRGNVTGTSVWGLSVNQMRIAYYGIDSQWHEMSFQLNERGWRWIANGTSTYTSAGNRPNTLLEELSWSNGYIPSQFYPDLPNYYFPDAPRSNHNAVTGGSYGGILPYENNNSANGMMNNWPEFHQMQAMENWATPDNNSQVRGAVDHDDQLVFLAENGQKVSSYVWYQSAFWSCRVQVDIVDPVDNGHSWMYVYYNPSTYATRPTPANQILADYCRTDSYIPPGEASCVNWNPNDFTIMTTNYQTQMNPNNAAQFLDLKLTLPGLLQTNIMQEFPKDFAWADGRFNLAGTTSISAIHAGLAMKYGSSGTWYQSSTPGLNALTGGQAPSDAPRSYNDDHFHVGIFYNHGNPDQTKHPAYGEPPFYQNLGWMDNTGAKSPMWFNFGTTNPASTTMGAFAVREQWVTFTGAVEDPNAWDYAGYCYNDSAYWTYSSGALATASGTTSGSWNQVLSPFQNSLGADGGAFNRKEATINGPVMAYIERIGCMRVVIQWSWLHVVNNVLLSQLTSSGSGFVQAFECFAQQDVIVYPNAFYLVNITYPIPSLDPQMVQLGASLDHAWHYFNIFQVTRGIETIAPGATLILGQGVANDTRSPALSQMSAAMNLLSNSPAGRAFVIAHGFPVYNHLQQLASDNTAFVTKNYPFWTWATNVSKAPGNTATSNQGCTAFPKLLTFNNISVDDAANGYTATNTMGRSYWGKLTGQYHPWWDTSGAAPNQEQWIDNAAWRDSQIWNQDGGNAGPTTHSPPWLATAREMIPKTPRNATGVNVAPDWTILDVPNIGDIWIYMPQREISEVKSHYDATWQPNHGTADDTALVFKDNSSNVGNRIGCQEFGLFAQNIALGNSIIPFTIAMVFGNFGITGNTTAANLYGKREWVRNRLQLGLIFNYVMQRIGINDTVSNFGPVNHGLFYKPGDLVQLSLFTSYHQSTPPTTTLGLGIIGTGVSTSTGTLISGNTYRYTINFTWNGTTMGDNVGPTQGSRHDFYYACFSTPTISNATCGLFFDSVAPTGATFTLPPTTTSTFVTIDWNGHHGVDNSDGTLRDAYGDAESGIGSYVVLRNGNPVQTITGPGNGGTTFAWIDINGGAGFAKGTVLQYSLQTVDMAGNVATHGPVTTTISPPVSDPGALDATIKTASSVPFQLTWNQHPGSGLVSYNILRSTSQIGGYITVASGLPATSRSWTQDFGNPSVNASLINTDDMYWYILQSNDGSWTVDSAPVPVIRDTTAPSPPSIVPLTSPYAPTIRQIPIDITGLGKSVDPGYYAPGNPNNMGSGVATYSIYRAVDSGGGFGTGETLRATVAASVIENNVWYDVDPGLTNNYRYRYWVIATDIAGNQANSTRIQFIIMGNPPPPNGVLDITSMTSNVTSCLINKWIGCTVKILNIGDSTTTINTLAVKVSWSGIDETSQYTVISPANFTSGMSIGAGVTDCFLFKLRPNPGADLGQAFINSTATWPGGTTWPSNLPSVLIQQTVPGTPTILSATGSSLQVLLTWNAPANNGGSAITGYDVYWGTMSGGETLQATIGNVTNYAATGLTPGQVYYFQITAINAIGQGPRSNEVAAIYPGPEYMPPTATRGVTATAGNMQVVLTWMPPASNGGSSITGYKVHQGTTSGGETLLVTLGNVTTYTSTGLTNGQVYYFIVQARNAYLYGVNSTEASTMPIGPPSAPQSLIAIGGSSQVILNWTAPASNGGSAITGYNVYQGTTSNNETLLVSLGVVLTYKSTGLTNGSTYYYKVAAVNNQGMGPNATEASVIPGGFPSSPMSFSATAGDTQVILNWATPAGDGGFVITGYNVYQGTTPGGETSLVSLGVVLTYTSTGLTNGVTYYYTVAAVNSQGIGANATEASTMPVAVPGAPTGFTATPGNAQVVLTWNMPGSNGGLPITNYRIYEGTTSNGEILLATVGSVLTYTVQGLTNGVTYYYTVAAVNSQGSGANTTEASTMPVTVPGAPTGFTTRPGNTQVSLTWAAPLNDGGSAILNYSIFQGTTSGNEILLVTIGNVLTYTSTGLTNGQGYYFKVVAVNAAGIGPNSTEENAIPSTVPTAPPTFTATAIKSSIFLSWTTPLSNCGTPITNYRIYRGTAPASEILIQSIGNVTTFNDTIASAGQMYYYKVAAVNGAGTGTNSTEGNAMICPVAITSVSGQRGMIPVDTQVAAGSSFPILVNVSNYGVTDLTITQIKVTFVTGFSPFNQTASNDFVITQATSISWVIHAGTSGIYGIWCVAPTSPSKLGRYYVSAEVNGTVGGVQQFKNSSVVPYDQRNSITVVTSFVSISSMAIIGGSSINSTRVMVNSANSTTKDVSIRYTVTSTNWADMYINMTNVVINETVQSISWSMHVLLPKGGSAFVYVNVTLNSASVVTPFYLSITGGICNHDLSNGTCIIVAPQTTLHVVLPVTVYGPILLQMQYAANHTTSWVNGHYISNRDNLSITVNCTIGLTVMAFFTSPGNSPILSPWQPQLPEILSGSTWSLYSTTMRVESLQFTATGLVTIQVSSDINGTFMQARLMLDMSAPACSSVLMDGKGIKYGDNVTVEVTSFVPLTVDLMDNESGPDHATVLYWDLRTNAYSRANLTRTSGQRYAMVMGSAIGSFWRVSNASRSICVIIATIDRLGNSNLTTFAFIIYLQDTTPPNVDFSNVTEMASQLLVPGKEYMLVVHVPEGWSSSIIESVIMFYGPNVPSSSAPNSFDKWQNTSGMKNVTFIFTSGDAWVGVLPKQEPGTVLYWAFYAVDGAGNSKLVVGIAPLRFSQGMSIVDIAGAFMFLGVMLFGIVFSISYLARRGVQSMKKASSTQQMSSSSAGRKIPISVNILTKTCPVCNAIIGRDLDECPYCRTKFTDENDHGEN